MALPPLHYLSSFEAAARSLSFTAAAGELNLSQAAVSGHVRALEQFVGGPLFERHARSLSLTTLGTAYLPSVQQALALVAIGTDSIIKRRDGRKVVISCPVTLAEGWLAGVITRFSAIHPEIAITIHARVWQDEPPEIADLILASAHQDAIATGSAVLWRDRLVLCAAPGYAAGDLSQARWIQVLSHTDFWPVATAALGLTSGDIDTEPTFTSSFSTALALARDGHGIAVVPLCYAERALSAGHVVSVLDRDLPIPYAMTLTQPEAKATASITAARDHIIAAAKEAPHAR
ncbi:MAG: LysR substrate-binding domain-containing protein [Pseudomonadota bacterium]